MFSRSRKSADRPVVVEVLTSGHETFKTVTSRWVTYQRKRNEDLVAAAR